MKHYRLVVLMILAIVLIAAIPAAQAQTVKPHAYVSEGVYQALKSGPARVLVVLDVPASNNLQSIRDSVAAAQATVLNALNPRLYTLNAQYSHLGVLSMSIEPEALTVLTGLSTSAQSTSIKNDSSLTLNRTRSRRSPMCIRPGTPEPAHASPSLTAASTARMST